MPKNRYESKQASLASRLKAGAKRREMILEPDVDAALHLVHRQLGTANLTETVVALIVEKASQLQAGNKPVSQTA